MFPIFYLFDDYALLALRLALGLVLLAHGWPKLKNLRGTGEWFSSVGFRPGIFWAAVAAVVEFFGGLALVLGFGVQVAAFFVAGQFAVINFWRIFLKRHALVGGFELDLIILGSALALVALGGGAWSLERFFGF
ncbi:MAG: DoxX family protein [Patescibacteria group bacterium]